jgi:alpha-tubulin suppressor-like RCC1 family protein
LAERKVPRFLLRKDPQQDDVYDYSLDDVEIVSADPQVVAVEGTTLVANKPGIVMVQILNQATGHSLVLRIEVLDQVTVTEGQTSNTYHTVPALDVGEGFSVVLKTNGTVWTWGDNEKGQQGANKDPDLVPSRSSPGEVCDSDGTVLDDIQSIAAGADHVVALAKNGVVYTWGSNEHGQLGFDTDEVEYKNAATPVGGLPSNGMAVYAGAGYSLLLTKNGEVWGWGFNDRGQLGVGYTGRNQTFSDYEKYKEEFEELRDQNMLPDDAVEPIYTSDVIIPRQVYQGESASRSQYLTNIVDLYAGDAHVLALRADGALFAWGDNADGQLGVGHDQDLTGVTFSYHVPVKVGAFTMEWREDEQKYVETAADAFPCVLDIAAGAGHSMAMLTDGSVYSWGNGGYGQLGRQENGANADMVGDATYLNEYTMDTSKEPPVEVPPVLPDTLPLSVAAPWRMTTLGGARIYGIYAGGDVSGAITAAGKQGIDVACGDGKVLRVTELQAKGGKRMTAGAYLLGHPIQR